MPNSHRGLQYSYNRTAYCYSNLKRSHFKSLVGADPKMNGHRTSLLSLSVRIVIFHSNPSSLPQLYIIYNFKHIPTCRKLNRLSFGVDYACHTELNILRATQRQTGETGDFQTSWCSTSRKASRPSLHAKNMKDQLQIHGLKFLLLPWLMQYGVFTPSKE